MATATMHDMPDPLAAVREVIRRLTDSPNASAKSNPTPPHGRNFIWVRAEVQRSATSATVFADCASTLTEAAADPAGVVEAADIAVKFWPMACDFLREVIAVRSDLSSAPRSWRREADAVVTSVAKTVRTLALVWGDVVGEVPEDIAREVWTIRIPPLAYLRAMANSFWSATRYPFKSTTIDLETGRVLYRE